MDEISQREKRQIMHDTFLSRAQTDAEMSAGGRFKKQTESRVTGIPTYPKQPSGPWSQGFDQIVGVEPPLGQSVNDLPLIGEPHEIEKSLAPEPNTAANPTAVESEPQAPTCQFSSGRC